MPQHRLVFANACEGVLAHRETREVHAPRDVRHSSGQLRVDEVADAPQPQADGHEGGHEVRHRQETLAPTPCPQPHGHAHAHEPPVERHAAFPQAKEPQRIFEEGLEAIDEHETGAPADDDAGDAVEDEVGQIRSLEPRGPEAPQAKQVNGAERQQVHEAVPTDLQRPQTEDHRVELRIVHRVCSRIAL